MRLLRRFLFLGLIGGLVGVGLATLGEYRLRALASTERPWSVAPHQTAGLPPGHDWLRSLRRDLDYVRRPGPRGDPERSSWGYRGPDPALTWEARPPRVIAVLGDSMTFGAGVRPDQAYPQLLEKRLPAGTRVHDLALPGYQVRDALGTLEQVAMPYLDPDLVVYAFYSNDLADTSLEHHRYAPRYPLGCAREPDSDHPSRAALAVARLWSALRSHSALWDEIRHRAQRFRYEHVLPHRDAVPGFLRDRMALFAPVGDGCAEHALGWVVLEAMVERARDGGVPLLIFQVPNLEALEVEEPGSAEELLMAFAAAHPDVRVVLTREELARRARRRGLGTEDLILGDGDTHPTPRGHALLAEMLAESLPEALAPR